MKPYCPNLGQPSADCIYLFKIDGNFVKEQYGSNCMILPFMIFLPYPSFTKQYGLSMDDTVLHVQMDD